MAERDSGVLKGERAPSGKQPEREHAQLERPAPRGALPGAPTVARIRALQRKAGNRATAEWLHRLSVGGVPAIQREDGEGRYVRYEITPHERAESDRLRAALEEGIPADQRTGIAGRMVLVLPAAAEILDEHLSAEFSEGQILNPGSSCHPASHPGLEPGDLDALWDLWKARWDSPNAATRRRWLRSAQNRIGELSLPWATRSYVREPLRATVRRCIESLVRERIAALRNDSRFVTRSADGRHLVPVVTPVPQRPRGTRERALTPEQTGEQYVPPEPGAPVTAQEIEAARAEIQVEVVSSQMVEFVNTEIIAPMPVAEGDETNIRVRAFRQLIELLRQQEALEAEVERLSSAQAGPQPDPALAAARQRLEALRAQIAAEVPRARDAALAWYRQQEAEIPVGTEPVEPTAAEGQRLSRPRAGSGNARTRLFYVRRAIAALEANRLLVRYRREHYRGTVAGARIEIAPAQLGTKVDRPQGHGGGGPGYIEGLLQERVQQSGLAAGEQSLALHVIQAFQVLEGVPQSLNTWDSAVLTLGSGLAARGVLQRTLHEFKQAAPDAFRALFGRYGIDVYGSGENWNLSVQVPHQTPGGQTTLEELRGEQAIEYIVNDPVLLVQLRRAGHARPWQIHLIDGALGSLRRALGYQFQGVAWGRVMEGLPAPLVEGSYFALANNWHASGGTGKVDRALNAEWGRIDPETELTLEQMLTDPAGLAFRQRLAVASLRAPAANRLRRFVDQVPGLAPFVPRSEAPRRRRRR